MKCLYPCEQQPCVISSWWFWKFRLILKSVHVSSVKMLCGRFHLWCVTAKFTEVALYNSSNNFKPSDSLVSLFITNIRVHVVFLNQISAHIPSLSNSIMKTLSFKINLYPVCAVVLEKAFSNYNVLSANLTRSIFQF